MKLYLNSHKKLHFTINILGLAGNVYREAWLFSYESDVSTVKCLRRFPNICYIKAPFKKKLVWTRIHNDFGSIVCYHHKVQWSEILVRFFTHSGLNLSELYCKNQAWTLLHLEIPRGRNHGFLLKYKNCVLYDFAWHILSYWSAGFQQRY